eukprot:8155540-Alexandrium_andersonii.AAC.1
MSASLVGSEMCIRDSSPAILAARRGLSFSAAAVCSRRCTQAACRVSGGLRVQAPCCRILAQFARAQSPWRTRGGQEWPME